MFRSHMEPNPILRTLGEAGTGFAGVLANAAMSGDLFVVDWCGSGRFLAILHQVPDNRFSIYDALVVDAGLGMLAIDQKTLIVRNN